jgi:site-specific recombinase XerD
VKFTDIAAHKQMFLRHSLATFFSSNEVHPSVIQTMLRHAKPQTTARYIQSVNSKQVEAQGKYLEAIKLGNDGKEAA